MKMLGKRDSNSDEVRNKKGEGVKMLKNKLGLAILFFCLTICMMIPVSVQAEGTIQALTIDGTSIYKNGTITDNYELSEGLSYDPGSNTITMTNYHSSDDPFGIEYRGTADIRIVVSGNNTISSGLIVLNSYYGECEMGDLYISGQGTLVASGDTFLIAQLNAMSEDYSRKQADVYIENVTLTGGGIMLNSGDVHIKDAKMNINGSIYGLNGGPRFGIYTGALKSGYEGELFIENSDLEFQNCDAQLHCTAYHFSGVNIYGGESAASYQIEASELFHEEKYKTSYTFYEASYDYGYLRITPQDLGLPEKDSTSSEPTPGDTDSSGQDSGAPEKDNTSSEPASGDTNSSGQDSGLPEKDNAGSQPTSSDTNSSGVVSKSQPQELKQLSKGTVIENVSGGNYKVSGMGMVEFTKPVGAKKTVVIPNNITKDGVSYRVTSIAANAFKNNKKVTKVVIGGNVQKIGANAFSGCKKLKSVSTKSMLTSIGAKAFSKCTALTGIDLPYNLKSVGKQAFLGCSKLKKINIHMQNIAKGKIGSKAFSGVNRNVTVNIYNMAAYFNDSKAAAIKKILKAKGMPAKAKYKIKTDF